MSSVSYTHLRNAKITLIKLNSVQRFSMMSSLTDLVSVSYTHLDVYKRQISDSDSVKKPVSEGSGIN